jgi:purine-nucleoside phosphorylase
VNKPQNYSKVLGCPLPQIALIAGSGIAQAFSDCEVLHEWQQSAFGVKSVPAVLGHSSWVRIVHLAGIPVLLFGGRLHQYEGHSPQECTAMIRLLVQNGCNSFILTNAAGALSPLLQVGSLMLLSNCSSSGQHTMLDYLWERGHCVQHGRYAQVLGPNYETRAEIAMLRIMGYHAVGMSTAHEAATAIAMGARVMSYSVISNICSTVHTTQLAHHHVVSGTQAARHRIFDVVESTVAFLDNSRSL